MKRAREKAARALLESILSDRLPPDSVDVRVAAEILREQQLAFGRRVLEEYGEPDACAPGSLERLLDEEVA